MKLKLHTAILILLGLFYLNAAKGQLGGQITASLISSTKVVVKAEIYRDCRGMAYNKNSFSYGCFLWKSSTNTTCTTKALTIPYLKFKDITYVEKGAKAPCSLGASGSNGIELDYFIDTIDLSTSGIAALISSTGCTNLSFYLDKCCRPSYLSNGAGGTNFYLQTTIYLSNLNRCKKKTNVSPSILFYPHTAMTDLEKHAYTPAPVDSIENDKITCNLNNPLESGPNKMVKLTSPYTANAPIPTMCTPTGNGFCAPNMTTDPVKGFSFDTLTGRMVYFLNITNTIGTGNGFTNSAMLFNEYRQDTSKNWVQIGQTMREFSFNVQNVGGYNNPPNIETTAELSATAGKSFYKEIKVTDNIKTGYQTAADTVLVTAVSGCKGLLMYVKNPKDREKIVVISGTPDTTYCSKTPYRMSILANDQYKNYVALASAQIMVRVKPLGSYTASVKMGNCNRVVLNFKAGKEVTGTVNVTWTVKDSVTGKVEYTGFGTLTTFADSSKTLSKGVKIITVSVTGSDFGFDPRTFIIDASYEAKFTISGITSYCRGSLADLSAVSVTMKKIKSVQYTVGTNYSYLDTLNKFNKLNVDSNMILMATAKDILGCTATLTTKIKMLPLPEKQFTKGLNICQNENQFDLLALCSLKSTENIQLSSNDGYVSFGQYFDATQIPSSEFTNNAVVTKTVNYFIIDGNSCWITASVDAKIYRLPQMAVDSIQLCQNTLSLNLDKQIKTPSASNLSKYIYQWKVVSNPPSTLASVLLKASTDTIKRYFNYGNSASTIFEGRYTFQLTLTDTATHCTNTDILAVNIVNEPLITFTPNLTFCANKANIDLFFDVKVGGNNVTYGVVKLTAYNNSNMNATFYNTALVNGHYLPKNAAEGRWKYSYTGPLIGCRDTATNELRILSTPDAVFSLSTDTLIDVETPTVTATNNSTISDNTTLNFEWNPGTGIPADNATTTNFSFTYPKIEKMYPLTLIATSAVNGCKDTMSKNIAIKKNVSTQSLQLMGGHFNDKLQVEGLASKIIEIRWFNTNGQLIAIDKQNNGISLRNGIYLYEILLENNTKNNVVRGKYFIK
jgi:hypothetical protein